MNPSTLKTGRTNFYTNSKSFPFLTILSYVIKNFFDMFKSYLEFKNASATTFMSINVHRLLLIIVTKAFRVIVIICLDHVLDRKVHLLYKKWVLLCIQDGFIRLLLISSDYLQKEAGIITYLPPSRRRELWPVAGAVNGSLYQGDELVASERWSDPRITEVGCKTYFLNCVGNVVTLSTCEGPPRYQITYCCEHLPTVQ